MTQQQIQEVKTQEVVFGDKAHSEILKGATILAEAVKSTMGPSGHSVIIDMDVGAPLITKDGVTVARSINLKDRLQSMGAELIKEVASKTNELAGDGTTTATVLAHTLLQAGTRAVATGCSSIELKKGMDIATETVLQFLKENVTPISGKEDIINVGTISANGDRELGQLIADAIEKVGQDGIITVEPAKSVHTTLNTVEGLQLDSGYVSGFFITNSEKANCEFENPYIVITANKIVNISDVVPIMEKAINANKPLVIIADDIEGEALHTLIVNSMKRVIKVCAIKAPSYGEHRSDLLGDLATVVGTEVVGATTELKIDRMKVENFGTCAKVIVNRGNTIFVGSDKDQSLKARTKERIDSLRTLLTTDNTLDEARMARYRQRLAKLSGGVAIIKVGGSTEIEIREKKDRVDDAVNATIAATQEGIVPGGGTMLFYASQYLKEYLKSEKLIGILSDDTMTGIKVVAEACEAPFRTIIGNTGRSPDVFANDLLKTIEGTVIYSTEPKTYVDEHGKLHTWKLPASFNKGFDARTGKYVDLIASGVIDPSKVTRLSLEHATSVVGLVLTCNSIIVNSEEKSN